MLHKDLPPVPPGNNHEPIPGCRWGSSFMTSEIHDPPTRFTDPLPGRIRKSERQRPRRFPGRTATTIRKYNVHRFCLEAAQILFDVRKDCDSEDLTNFTTITICTSRKRLTNSESFNRLYTLQSLGGSASSAGSVWLQRISGLRMLRRKKSVSGSDGRLDFTVQHRSV